jgi:hypothetical protein
MTESIEHRVMRKKTEQESMVLFCAASCGTIRKMAISSSQWETPQNFKLETDKTYIFGCSSLMSEHRMASIGSKWR